MTPTEVVVMFAELAGAVDGVTKAYDHEPEKIQHKAAVTLVQRHVVPQIIDVSGREEQTWRFRVYVYVQLGTYREAQMELLDLLPKLLRITQTNRTLNQTCSDSRLDDDGAEPDPRHREGYMTKRLTLTFKTLVEF